MILKLSILYSILIFIIILFYRFYLFYYLYESHYINNYDIVYFSYINLKVPQF